MALEFPTVSREFRSLVERRRELFTFLGSVFAAMGLFLRNILQGNLPDSLVSIQNYAFAFYALVLMVLSLILSLRMARLHGGLVLNGVLFARLMQEQDFTAKGNPVRAARHNFLGVSFLQFILVDLIAAFSAAILALALHIAILPSIALAIGVFVLWIALYLRFHNQAARFALAKNASDTCAPFRKQEWEEHVSACLEQANRGLIAEIAFAGLMVFSVFESLSGLGKITAERTTDLSTETVKEHGPLIYSMLMVVTCFLELIIYLRVRVAIGGFSLLLDPTDRPFRPLRLTDSLLGYMTLAFLFCVALHVLLIVAVPGLREHPRWLLAIDAAVLVVAILAEQITLVVAGRKKS
jgi:hypothetical protein